jgi:AcrR family transcriptional regulator
MRVKDYNKVNIIFKASLKLILKEGIAGLTMAKLAKKSGLATGTLYIYFKNKEELIHKLYDKLKEESLDRFTKGVEPSFDPKKAIKKIWINYLTHRLEHYEESIFMEQYYRSPYISEDTLALAESMKKPVHDVIKQGQEEGIVRKDAEVEMLFLSMLGFIRELADEHITGIFELNQERIEKAFELSWDLIKA